MKWIGQHIYDFISRFRSKIYLEDIDNAGSDTDAFLVKKADGEVAFRTGDNVLADLGISASEIVDWTTDQGGTNIHTENIHDLHGAGVDGAVGSVLTDDGSGGINSNFDFRWDGDQISLSSATSGKPVVQIGNTNADAVGPELMFLKNVTGADDDELGKISFYGKDDTQILPLSFAEISGYIADATNNEEAGRLELKVADHDSTMTTGLKLDGDHANGEVDVTIGAGAASTTTVAGNLVVTSDLTVSGTTTTINTTNLNVEDKNITLNYNASGDTSSTADEAGITIQDAVDGSNDAHFIWNASTDNWRLSHSLDISNGASSGVPALILDNDDVDQIALDIDAENTTANIIDIDAQDLTTGSAIYVDSHSTGTKSIINLDLDIPGNVHNEYTRGVLVDIDKTGNVATGENNYIHGLDVNFYDGGTNVGTSLFRGLYVTSLDANDSGGNSRYGVHLNMTGGDAGSTYGLRSKIENGGYDISMESSAEFRDNCKIYTGANGLTTILTTDFDASEADLVLNIDGEIVLDSHTNEDIFFKENGSERIQWHMDSTPTMEVTGSFDIDCNHDILIDSDTGHLKFKQSGNPCVGFDYNTTSSLSTIIIGDGTSSGNGKIEVTNSTGDWNGNLLTITGGDALDGTGNNRTGGDIIIKGGKGTGSARTGNIEFQLREAGGTAGTGERSPETAFKMSALKATLSEPTMNIFTVFEPGEDSDEYCRMTVADTGITTIETHDDTGSNGANLTLNIDGDISLDAHTAKHVFFKENNTTRFQFYLDSTPEMRVTGDFKIDGSGDVILEAAQDVTLNAGNVFTVNSGSTTFTSASANRPLVTIQNTANDATGPYLYLENKRDDNGLEDNDVLGTIAFIGEDDNGAGGGSYEQYGSIIGSVVESAHGDEAGQISIKVANDGTERNGITITADKGTAEEVDVTIANGAASMTTIAGDLAINGDTITSAGALAIRPADVSGVVFHLDANADTDNTVDIDAGALDIDVDAAMTLDVATNITIASPEILVRSNAVGKPLFTLESTDTTRTASSEFRFVKDADNVEDGEILGKISFYGDNDAGTPESIEYARILGLINDKTDGGEEGALSIQVASHDGELQPGLYMVSGDAEDKVDVNIGFGPLSMTTIKGDLDIDGDSITVAGALTITPAGVFSVAGGSSEIDLTTSGTVDINAGTLDVDATNVNITGTSNVIDGKTNIPRRQFIIPGDGAGSADGDVIYIGTNDGGGGGAATEAGAVYYYHSNGSWVKTNSNDPSTATGLLAVALGTDPDSNGMLLRGTVDLAVNIVGTEALGSILYLDKATSGAITTAAPTATGDIVRVVGYALTTGNTNKIWFNPDNTWVEHT